MTAKYRLRFLCFIAGIMVLNSALGQGMHQSHHEFSSPLWNGTEICKPCHIQDAGEGSAAPGMLLWNQHKVDIKFDLYSKSDITGIPGGNSKLCLSCHDGIIGSEIHDDNMSQDSKAGNLHGSMLINHPVSVVYDQPSTGSRSKLNDPNSKQSGLGGTIASDLLRNGKVECTSCHDIHVTRNNQGCTGCHTLANNGLKVKSLSLWKSNDYSALCLTCHKK